MKNTYSHYDLAQIEESALLTPERMTEVKEQIAARMLPCFGPHGKLIESVKIADMGDKWTAFIRLDHDQNYEYMQRTLLPVVLTKEEVESINKHCFEAGNLKREEAKFAKATKVTEWGGGLFYGDDFYPSMEELLDHISFNDDEDWPEYAWAAEPQQVITKLHVGDVVGDMIVDRGWEDMDVHDLNGVAELQKALDVFQDANLGVHSFREDRDIAVLIPKRAEILNPAAAAL